MKLFTVETNMPNIQAGGGREDGKKEIQGQSKKKKDTKQKKERKETKRHKKCCTNWEAVVLTQTGTPATQTHSRRVDVFFFDS